MDEEVLMPTYSPAEEARQLAAVSPATQWRREAEVWFDGSVESVDRRLAACGRLLTAAREAIVHDGIGADIRILSSVRGLEQQRQALVALRRDLLTAASDREAYWDGDPANREDGEHAHERWRAGEEMGHHLEAPDERFIHDPGFHEADRRYVELEAPKFFRANFDCSVDELAIRARHHAEVQTSTFTQKRSRDLTAAFVRRVTQLRRTAPRPRVASVPTRSQDFPPELMFM